MKTLLAAAVDANLRYGGTYGISTLGVAALMENLEVVRPLQKHGVDRHRRSNDRPLHSSCVVPSTRPTTVTTRQFVVVRELTRHGLDLDVADARDFTANAPRLVAAQRHVSGTTALLCALECLCAWRRGDHMMKERSVLCGETEPTKNAALSAWQLNKVVGMARQRQWGPFGGVRTSPSSIVTATTRST